MKDLTVNLPMNKIPKTNNLRGGNINQTFNVKKIIGDMPVEADILS